MVAQTGLASLKCLMNCEKPLSKFSIHKALVLILAKQASIEIVLTGDIVLGVTRSGKTTFSFGLAIVAYRSHFSFGTSRLTVISGRHIRVKTLIRMSRRNYGCGVFFLVLNTTFFPNKWSGLVW
jgi:hypothetical protein